MASIQCNLMQVHLGSCKMGQAQMTGGMGAQAWQLTPLSQSLDNFGPHDQRKWLSGISARFGQEECSLHRAECSSSAYVRGQEAARHLAVPDHALSSALGMLSTNSDLLIGKIEIGKVQRHQFLTTECAI